nr:MAG TPA: hypothetical protein [Caudoviricetes sp.]
MRRGETCASAALRDRGQHARNDILPLYRR